MACKVQNIADFPGTPFQNRCAHQGRARVYEFPEGPFWSRSTEMQQKESAHKTDETHGRRRLVLGIELAAGAFFFAVWLVWQMYR